MTLGIFLVIVLVNPLFALAPTIEKTDKLLIIQGTTLKATAPISVSHFATYGVLIDETDITTTQARIIKKIIFCESKGEHEGVWGDKGKAYGIAQFWENTFYWFAEMSGLENPDWKNKEQQIILLDWGLKNGYGEHWSCF